MTPTPGADQLTHLKLAGYKSIGRADLTFGALNVLVGANGAGKSNLISFFKLIRDLMDGRLQLHVGKAGGPDALLHYGRKTTEQLVAELTFGDRGYWLRLVPTADNRMTHALSDGTLRFICLATLLLQPREHRPATILIDEPELGLHPYAITVLAGLLKSTARQNQVIVSTQSVELISEFEAEDLIVVERHQGQSAFHRLDAAELQDWLQDYSLGELWKKNVFGGRPGW